MGTKILFPALLYGYLNLSIFCGESAPKLPYGAHYVLFTEILFSTICLLVLVAYVKEFFLMVLDLGDLKHIDSKQWLTSVCTLMSFMKNGGEAVTWWQWLVELMQEVRRGRQVPQ